MKTRAPRSDGVATREAILAAAEAEFADKGFELASAREICRRAEANPALLSRYFGSKEALYRIVAKRLFGDLGAPLAKLANGVSDDARWRAAVREKCSGCWALGVCGGPCPWEVARADGTFAPQDELLCGETRAWARQGAYYFHTVGEFDRNKGERKT